MTNYETILNIFREANVSYKTGTTLIRRKICDHWVDESHTYIESTDNQYCQAWLEFSEDGTLLGFYKFD